MILEKVFLSLIQLIRHSLKVDNKILHMNHGINMIGKKSKMLKLMKSRLKVMVD